MKCPQVPVGCHILGLYGFFPSYGSCELDVDRGRSVTVEQAFSGTNSFGKHSIFSNFCSEEGKKLKQGRVQLSTIFLRSFFLASLAQPMSFRDLSSQSIKIKHFF